MSQSPFARAFITSTCIAGAIFTASTFPLAVAESKVIDVELQNKPVFSSELRDLAAPYLMLSGGFSMAIGFGVFGVLGWQTASRKLAKIESQSATLVHDLAIHQAELERIRFSESRLHAQNLSGFLQASPSSQVVSNMMQSVPAIAASITEVSPAFNSYETVPLNGHRAVSTAAEALPSQVVKPGTEPETKNEVLSHLLQQLNQLAQQVEELQNNQPGGLAA